MSIETLLLIPALLLLIAVVCAAWITRGGEDLEP